MKMTILPSLFTCLPHLPPFISPVAAGAGQIRQFHLVGAPARPGLAHPCGQGRAQGPNVPARPGERRGQRRSSVATHGGARRAPRLAPSSSPRHLTPRPRRGCGAALHAPLPLPLGPLLVSVHLLIIRARGRGAQAPTVGAPYAAMRMGRRRPEAARRTSSPPPSGGREAAWSAGGGRRRRSQR
jgi:hypothetical protein